MEVELPASDSGGMGVAVDVHGKGKRGGLSFVRVDAATGSVQTVEVSRMELMRRCHLPLRDLRLLDPRLVNPCSIVVRERAIFCNLEQIQCIITADEVLLHNTPDKYNLQYAAELQRRQLKRREGDELPFEFRALELALEAACSFLDAQAAEAEIEAYPLLDELTTKFTTLNLERVRRIKSRLASLTRRAEKVRDEIEHLMEDDDAMAEMCLTEKKRTVETASVLDEQAVPGPSHSASVSPLLSPSASRMHDNLKNLLGSRDVRGSTEEGEIMLGAYFLFIEIFQKYFLAIDRTLTKLTELKEYIDDTQEFINYNLDSVRNQLIKFELLMNTSTFVTSILGVVLGIFGMNFEEPLFKVPHAFEWTLTITVVCGLFIFCFIVWYFKKRRFFPF